MRNNDGRLRTILATGLVPLLLLTGLPGCVARHMPDWSKVQAVAPDTKTEVQLYKEKSSQRSQKIKGRFFSATAGSVTLKLKNGQTETFQRKNVRKVLTRRPVAHRWPGWLALVTPIALVRATASPRGVAIDGTPAFYAGLFLPAVPFFIYPWMGGIYEVPPEHRDWFPQETNSSGAKTKKPETSK